MPDAISFRRLRRDSRTLTISRPDTIACSCLALIAVLVTAYKWHFDNWLLEMDLSTFFMPWFGELGSRLRQCDIPARNPYIFSGVPFAGDPETGWGYLPVMVLYTFFDVIVATKLLGFVLLLITALSTYALARRISLSPVGAFSAAGAYMCGPVAYTLTHCCTVAGLVGPFLPVGLLGIEIALGERRSAARFFGIILTGLAICQILAAWTGQGALYALIIFGSWTLYRGLTHPALDDRTVRAKLTHLIPVGILVLVLGIALSGAWLLPRIDANAESNLAGGEYTDQVGADYASRDYSRSSLLFMLITDSSNYRRTGMFAVVPFMAIIGAITLKRRSAAAYFVGIALLLYGLAADFAPIRWLLHSVPMAGTLHEHSPVRALWNVTFPASMLAGFAIDGVRQRRDSFWKAVSIALGAVTVILACSFWAQSGASTRLIDWYWIPLVIAAMFVMLVMAATELHLTSLSTVVRTIATGSLLILVVATPIIFDVTRSISSLSSSNEGVNYWANDPRTDRIVQRMVSNEDSGGAGEFLQHKREELQPFRVMTVSFADNDWYPRRRADDGMLASLQNGRLMFLDIENTGGYGPQKPAVYQEYMKTLNGKAQDYHFENLLPEGADSPLLDLLNVRYLVVDKRSSAFRDGWANLGLSRTIAYQDPHVIIFENTTVQPRAWMVYDVRRDPRGIVNLQTGTADGATTAFIDEEPPTIAPPTEGSRPVVVVNRWNKDSETFKVTQSGHGFLVMSEIWSKDWKARIDGKEARIYRTNTALMGIEMPPGEHTVTLTYAPASLAQGLLLSGISSVGAIGVLGYLWWRDRREGLAEHPVSA